MSGNFGRLIAALLASALVASCGGTSGSPAPGAPANRAPTFSSAGSATIPENSMDVFYTAAASDPDGDAVTYTIAGGADAGSFMLTGPALSLNAPANFDRYADADRNNVYEVTLQASDGRGGTSLLPLAVAISNAREGIAVTQLATGFAANSFLVANSFTTAIFAVEPTGAIWQVDPVTGTSSIIAQTFSAGETGRVIAAAESNLFVMVLIADGDRIVARSIPHSQTRFTTTRTIQLASGVVPTPAATLFTGSGSYLFAAIGDPPGNLAQDNSSGYGKVHLVQFARCGVTSDTYCLKSDYRGIGVREPAGGTDLGNLTLLLDRNPDTHDEASLFDMFGGTANFEWPYKAGTVTVRDGLIGRGAEPSLIFPRGTSPTQSAGLIGGLIYRGAVVSLQNNMVFADREGRFFVAPTSLLTNGGLQDLSRNDNRAVDFRPINGTLNLATGLGSNQSGRMFIMDQDGDLFAVDPG